MDISRRGVLGGLGAACAVGAVGFAGAATVTDGEAVGGLGGDGPGPTGGGSDGADDGPESAAVDPDAPFEARLTGADGADALLFDASDLDRVKGVFAEEGEYLVQVVLPDAGVETFRTRLDEAGATDDPAAFVVSMTLDGTEVRRVELDGETVDALTGSDWEGVLTLPFGEERVARSVYDRLADS
ncbi:hypothetical protein C465_08713 [Halorubrum distributum JCM 9100]|uniref:Uncharacterized protein n=3 Tax=Halorubrum distributum TaxID=29283 RepID=M0EQK9_9EURY|nr:MULTISPECIES: hypothetical protein [Halorubrum distributum group]ELZ31898.1 hypothetical protein C473_10348 [Halorubrum terrestre JCM 10247]ELZ49182.1 hypothetical protein C465_08713 [Halorubrum distributum JCM 9100]ELZ57756.1 hypothetical protein C466_01007 [Halorubrum distributum JCM 10118]